MKKLLTVTPPRTGFHYVYNHPFCLNYFRLPSVVPVCTCNLKPYSISVSHKSVISSHKIITKFTVVRGKWRTESKYQVHVNTQAWAHSCTCTASARARTHTHRHRMKMVLGWDSSQKSLGHLAHVMCMVCSLPCVSCTLDGSVLRIYKGIILVLQIQSIWKGLNLQKADVSENKIYWFNLYEDSKHTWFINNICISCSYRQSVIISFILCGELRCCEFTILYLCYKFGLNSFTKLVKNVGIHIAIRINISQQNGKSFRWRNLFCSNICSTKSITRWCYWTHVDCVWNLEMVTQTFVNH